MGEKDLQWNDRERQKLNRSRQEWPAPSKRAGSLCLLPESRSASFQSRSAVAPLTRSFGRRAVIDLIVSNHARAQFSISFVRNIFLYSASRGADLDSLCAAANLSHERLNCPDEMVPGTLVERAWQVAISQTADPHLALHLGEAIHPAALGLLGFAMLSCQTLGEALKLLSKHWALLSNATTIHQSCTPTVLSLELAVLDLPGNFLLHNRDPVESSLSAAVGLVRALTGHSPALVEVTCTYDPPVPPLQLREYERVFGRGIRFQAESNCIHFSREVSDWPVIHANPGMLASFEEQIRKRLNHAPSTVADRVRLEISRKLRGELPTLQAISQSLHVSRRALQRGLQMEGTTFLKVLDDLRRDLALDYLADARNSIADVTFLLGFSEPSVLHRYFRRWQGTTPQAYRRSLNQPALPPKYRAS